MKQSPQTAEIVNQQQVLMTPSGQRAGSNGIGFKAIPPMGVLRAREMNN